MLGRLSRQMSARSRSVGPDFTSAPTSAVPGPTTTGRTVSSTTTPTTVYSSAAVRLAEITRSATSSSAANGTSTGPPTTTTATRLSIRALWSLATIGRWLRICAHEQLDGEVGIRLSRVGRPDLRDSADCPAPCRGYDHLQQSQCPDGESWIQLPVQLGRTGCRQILTTDLRRDHKGSGSRTGARSILPRTRLTNCRPMLLNWPAS
jgi:hypothetical protein